MSVSRKDVAMMSANISILRHIEANFRPVHIDELDIEIFDELAERPFSDVTSGKARVSHRIDLANVSGEQSEDAIHRMGTSPKFEFPHPPDFQYHGRVRNTLISLGPWILFTMDEVRLGVVVGRFAGTGHVHSCAVESKLTLSCKKIVTKESFFS